MVAPVFLLIMRYFSWFNASQAYFKHVFKWLMVNCMSNLSVSACVSPVGLDTSDSYWFWCCKIDTSDTFTYNSNKTTYLTPDVVVRV